METKSRQKSPKIASIFSCEKCNYKCRKESDYKKHLLTRKHLKETNGNIGNIKETKKAEIKTVYLLPCIKDSKKIVEVLLAGVVSTKSVHTHQRY